VGLAKASSVRIGVKHSTSILLADVALSRIEYHRCLARAGIINRKSGAIRARFHMKDEPGSQSILQKYFDVRASESNSGRRVFLPISLGANGTVYCVFSCDTAGSWAAV